MLIKTNKNHKRYNIEKRNKKTFKEEKNEYSKR